MYVILLISSNERDSRSTSTVSNQFGKKKKNYNNNSLIPGIIYLLYFCQIDIKNNIQY